jgi:hypothetical protein
VLVAHRAPESRLEQAQLQALEVRGAPALLEQALVSQAAAVDSPVAARVSRAQVQRDAQVLRVMMMPASPVRVERAVVLLVPVPVRVVHLRVRAAAERPVLAQDREAARVVRVEPAEAARPLDPAPRAAALRWAAAWDFQWAAADSPEAERKRMTRLHAPPC